MRTISDESAQVTPAVKKATKSALQTFSITIREMTGRDLIFMEKDLSKAGDVEKGMKIIERLIVGEDKITYEEILDLGVRDFKKLSGLVGEASGSEDEDPN